MPNPGDAGSSLGAIAAHVRRHLNWRNPYLEYNIERRLDVGAAGEALERGAVIGVANGRAEFGPRTLGNRSMFSDPRGNLVKDQIKRRETFRPFAPIVMAEMAHEYFLMPVESSPYMQFVAKGRDPARFPAITHYDGTARVQTLERSQNPAIYELLECCFARTGCPMLVNTSLNIKGEPLVNTWADAQRFSDLHSVRVF
jgi:carbamoyltransferase